MSIIICMVIILGIYLIISTIVLFAIKYSVNISINYVKGEEFLKSKGYRTRVISFNEVCSFYYALKNEVVFYVMYIYEIKLFNENISILVEKMKENCCKKGILICDILPSNEEIEYCKNNDIEIMIMPKKDIEENKIKKETIIQNPEIEEKINFDYIEKIEEDFVIKEPKKSFFKKIFKKPDRL